MKILNIHIDDFGKLHDFDMDFTTNPCCVIEDNGWGKSTLAAFIRVMFFGFSGENKKKANERERTKFAPWNKGNFGGKIIFLIGTKEYELTRHFGAKEKDDTGSIVDMLTMLEAKEYDVQSLGERIFGIDAGAFARTAFIGQDDIKLSFEDNSIDDSILAKILNLSDDIDDVGGFDRAMQILLARKRELQSGHKLGIIPKLKEERNRLMRDVNMSEGIDKAIIDTKDALLEKENRLRELVGKDELLNKELALAHRKSEYESLIQEKRIAFDSKGKNAGTQIDEKSCETKLKGRALWCFALIMTCASVIFYLVDMEIFAAFSFLCAIFIIFGSIWKKVTRMKGETYENGLASRFNDVREQEKIEQDLVSNKGLIEACQDSISKLKSKLTDYYEKKDELKQDASLLEEVTQKIRDSEDKYDIISKAMQYMEEAKQAMASRYMKPILESFRRYYEYIETDADDYSIDANINLFKDELGERRTVCDLSRGYKDLVGIAFRMSLIAVMYEGEKPFVVLDDPFVNLDTYKLTKAKTFLEAIAKEYQIIYFTCHESRI